MASRKLVRSNLLDIKRLLQPTVKKKKTKNPVREFMINTGRSKMKKKPSVIAETANELIKLKYNTPELINKYFYDNARIIDDQQRNLYSVLVKSKVQNGRFILNDNFANAPMHLYGVINDFKTGVITNDWLWLNLMRSRYVTKEKLLSLKDSPVAQNLFTNSNVSRVQICAPPFVAKTEVKSGYYQDYKTNFACIGMSGMNVEEKKKICSSNFTYKFTCEGINYNCKGTNNACVIYPGEQSADDLYNFVAGCKVFYLKEKKPTLTTKVMEIKGEHLRFVDCSVYPEKFCPAFLKTENELEYNCLIVCEANYNDVFKYMDDNFKINNDNNTYTIAYYANSWYWDNTSSWFDFLYIYALTSPKLLDVARTYLIQICDVYYIYKDMIEGWKKNQLFYQKLLAEFYNAFSTKINWDKVDSLLQKVEAYIEMRDFLMYDDSYPIIKNWIQKISFCYYIKNQFTDEVFKIADTMKETLYNIVKKRDVLNITEKLRVIGLMIYQSSAIGIEGGLPAFPVIFSQGGFLGNLWNSDLDYGDPLKENVQKLINKSNDNEERTTFVLDQVQDVFRDMNKYRLNVIRLNVKALAAQDNVNFTDEEVDKIAKVILSDLSKNEELSNELNSNIFSELRRVGNLNNLVIKSPDFVNFVKQISNQRKDEILRQQEENIRMRRQINNLNNQINSNQQNQTGYVAQSDQSQVSSSQSQQIYSDQPSQAVFSGQSSQSQSQPASSSQQSSNPVRNFLDTEAKEMPSDYSSVGRYTDSMFNVSSAGVPGISTSDKDIFSSNIISKSKFKDYVSEKGEVLSTIKSKNDQSIAEFGEKSKFGEFMRRQKEDERKKKKSPDLIKYYADIVYFSGFYPEVKSPNILINKFDNVTDMMAKYPLNPSVIEVIIDDNYSIMKDINRYSKETAEVSRDNSINYKDENYINKRILDIFYKTK